MSRYIDIEPYEKDGGWYLQKRYHNSYGEVIKTTPLVSVPTADVEMIKPGKWKPFDLTWGRSVYACTNCGQAMEVPTESGKPMYDYCPNCGAKMDGEENG